MAKILLACEESQAVTLRLRQQGHDAYSCDLLPTSGNNPEWHIQSDVTELLKEKWDMIIAFPPCTHLASSGAAHFKKKREDGRQRAAIEFFMQFLNANCDKIVVENPIGIIGGGYVVEHFPDLAEKYKLPIKPTQIIQPWQFGDSFQKSTCLWIKGLPKLISTSVVDKGEFKEWIDPKTKKIKRQPLWFYQAFLNSKDRKDVGIIRSKTFPGIADAMAQQWGKLLDT